MVKSRSNTLITLLVAAVLAAQPVLPWLFHPHVAIGPTLAASAMSEAAADLASLGQACHDRHGPGLDRENANRMAADTLCQWACALGSAPPSAPLAVVSCDPPQPLRPGLAVRWQSATPSVPTPPPILDALG